jgi:hypothetical protein
MRLPRRDIILCVVAAISIASAPRGVRALVPSDAQLETNRRIWNAAPHNAFTDLIHHNEQFYVTFREASRHGVPPVGQAGGNIRILRSADGVSWSSSALVSFGTDNDLRDPKLSVAPDNRLMLLAIDQPHQPGSQRQSYTWFSPNGSTWGAANPIVEQPRWMWRVAWHEGTAYGISYTNNLTRLHASADGINFSTRVNTLTSGNETGLLFRDDGSAVALVRREGAGATVGTSTGNFTNWTWHDTPSFVGGPSIIELPDGRIVAGGRLTDGVDRMSLAFLNPSSGALDEFLTFPSGGDTGYPGLSWHQDKLWVSYYSSHQGKASIYLATVTFSNVPEPACIAALATAAPLALCRRRTRAVASLASRKGHRGRRCR